MDTETIIKRIEPLAKEFRELTIRIEKHMDGLYEERGCCFDIYMRLYRILADIKESSK